MKPPHGFSKIRSGKLLFLISCFITIALSNNCYSQRIKGESVLFMNLGIFQGTGYYYRDAFNSLKFHNLRMTSPSFLIGTDHAVRNKFSIGLIMSTQKVQLRIYNFRTISWWTTSIIKYDFTEYDYRISRFAIAPKFHMWDNRKKSKKKWDAYVGLNAGLTLWKSLAQGDDTIFTPGSDPRPTNNVGIPDKGLTTRFFGNFFNSYPYVSKIDVGITVGYRKYISGKTGVHLDLNVRESGVGMYRFGIVQRIPGKEKYATP